LSSVPETRYARNGDVHLAYQSIGVGPPDVLIITMGPGGHVEYQWEEPSLARAILRMASYGRFITFDNRGVGLSDPLPRGEVPTMEQYVDDIRAVLDEVGSRRTVLIGYVAGCAPAMLFAATYPERVESLILCGPYARLLRDDDYPIGLPPETVEAAVLATLEGWGKAAALDLMDPVMARDERFRRWWAQMERVAASPGTAAQLVRQWFDIDVRSLLATIRVPTLVLSRKQQVLFTVAMAKYVADRIPNSQYVELPGSELHFFIGETEPVFQAIETFLGREQQTWEPDRSLATVLVTDVVGSTALAARIGDARWRDLQQSYFRLVTRQLERFRGRLVDTAGDGVLAVFDAPGRAIACAEAIRDAVRALGIQVRSGLHTGEIEQRQQGGGIGGIAVHIGARISSLAGAGDILVSRTIKDLVAGSSIRLESRGDHELKGVPDSWEIYAVAN
jgi:pimeloyl-ACP methyl ester carboxylesterase